MMWAALVQAAAAGDPGYAAAVEARLAGRTDEAISAFEALSRQRPSDPDVWLNLGLSYTAAQRYDAAERALATALRLAPDYGDAQLAAARLAWFRGDRQEAAKRLAALRLARPTDPEVLGLAAQIAASPAPLAWRFDVSHAQSWLTKGLGEWRATTIAMGRSGEGAGFNARIEHTERFGREDVYLEAGVGRASGRSDVALAVGAGVDPDYRAQWVVRLGTGWRLASDPGSNVRLGADGFWARYAAGDVRTVQPSLTLSGERHELELRTIATLDERDDLRVGYAVRGAWRLTPSMQILGGWTDAPESSEGVTVKVRSASVGAAFALSPALAVRADLTHEMRRGYDRNEVALALTRRF